MPSGEVPMGGDIVTYLEGCGVWPSGEALAGGNIVTYLVGCVGYGCGHLVRL